MALSRRAYLNPCDNPPVSAHMRYLGYGERLLAAYPAVVDDVTERLSVGVVAARIGLVVGGLTCLVVTPSFASAYYLAYGRGGGESPPPGWLAGIGPSWFAGADAVSTYNSYGVVFGFALMIVVISLGVVVAAREGKGTWESRAWRLIIGGLGAVAVGSLMEYGIPEDVLDAGYGFMLELAGFVIIAVGTVVLGWAVHREAEVGTIPSIGIALVGPVGIVAGTAIVGHLPSGPASLLMLAAIIIGAIGLPDTPRP